MKTISIGTQSSAAALAQAFADALAAEISWTADENGCVKKDGISVYFKFATSGTTNAKLTISNGYKDSDGGVTCAFSASNTYKLYLLETVGGSIAVGISPATGALTLGILIVRNAAGTYVGITSSSTYAQTLRGIESATRTVSLATTSTAGVSTSIVRMPDIWGATMFNDLYYVISCPFQSTDRVFYIGGKNYRSVGANSGYMFFALPEE
ncbi:MAG: hypothetical protein K2N06_02080 [Oscillospiraceae bacterium]|nr:hypothetical protein [Oscillospiraceae bacterium]